MNDSAVSRCNRPCRVADDVVRWPFLAVDHVEKRDEGDVLAPRVEDFCFVRDGVPALAVFHPVVVRCDFGDFVRFVSENCFVHFLVLSVLD